MTMYVFYFLYGPYVISLSSFPLGDQEKMSVISLHGNDDVGWKCCSLVFIFGSERSILTMFSCQNVAKLFKSNQDCCLQNRLYLASIKGCGLENQTFTSQSIHLGLEESETG